jgi:hypothetical protein
MTRSEEILHAIKIKSQAMQILEKNFVSDIEKLTTELSEILAGDRPDEEIII